MDRNAITGYRLSSLLKIIFTLILTVFIAIGCSSSSSDTPAGDSNLTGTFIDSAVQGVDYTTSSGLTGTTDASGTFTYAKGDTVSFSLAGIDLGQAAGASEITVLDIVGASQPRQNQLNKWVDGDNMNNGLFELLRIGKHPDHRIDRIGNLHLFFLQAVAQKFYSRFGTGI